MDSVETRVAEQLGFRVERIDKMPGLSYLCFMGKDGHEIHDLVSARFLQLWDALLAAERRGAWIKVTPESMPTAWYTKDHADEEKFPEYLCLVDGDDGIRQEVCAWYDDDFVAAGGYTLTDKVKYYQPLPAPPEEVEP